MPPDLRSLAAASQEDWSSGQPLTPPLGPSAHEQLTRRYPLPTDPYRLPDPTGLFPYRLALDEVLAPSELESIRRTGVLRFHAVGDTGGHANPIPQRAVAAAMAIQCAGERPVSFLYHLGDLVYPHGEPGNYGPQFYDAYADYPAAILGVAGNHDGERGEAGVEPFVRQFCAPSGDPGPDPRRLAQHQPHLHWTLRHEWLTLIGLHTGVPDGGHLEQGQRDWLVEELRAAPRGVTLILAMHHPVFSADVVHGSNLRLRDVLDECFARAGRSPDAVLGAHAHNYQRFARTQGGRTVPYVVTGSGGFPALHELGYGIPEVPAAFTGLPGVTLEAHQQRAFGFLTISASADGAQAVYSVVVRRRPVAFDSFVIRPVT